MFIRPASFTLLFLLAAGCSAPPETDLVSGDDAIETSESSLRKKTFVDALSYFTNPADSEAWFELMSRLAKGFDDICGDTFCEGDYPNYEPLSFRCSVEEQAGTIGKCVWIFAASNEEVVPSTGNIKVDAKTWSCRMPIGPATPISAFVTALSAPGVEPIHAALPGTGLSLYDGLTGCL